jgi:diguanylate cyclase (GGDEF)-like protein
LSHDSSIDLSQFPDSPYAEQLRTGGSLRFAPALEAEFRRRHLDRARSRARTWSVVTAGFSLLFTLMEVRTEGLLHPISLLHYFLVPLALVAAWLPWSRYYHTLYLPIVGMTMPISSALSAPFSAQGAAEGRYEVLMLLALQVVGIYQFTGLLYRSALATCVALTAGFAVGTVIWELPPDAAGKYVFALVLATVLGAVSVRGTEGVARTEFLEGKLLGELLERDPLTGLKNRRSFDEHLQRAWMQAQRDGRTVAVLMIDVDEFKRYNDMYGHQAGDEALRRVSGVLREFGKRPLDLVARYGGEEFAIVLHDVTLAHAREVAEHVRRSVEALAIAHRGATAAAAGAVTLSVGVALAQPTVGRTAHGAVQLADEALYEAKAAGRNRVVVKGLDAYREVDTGVFMRPEGLHS